MVKIGSLSLICALTVAVFAPMPAPAQGLLAQIQDEVASMVSRARPAIVSIADERFFGGPRNGQNSGVSDRHEGAGREHEKSGAPQEHPRRPPFEPPKIGTGFSVGDGYIITTADVLGGMKSPIVTTDDGRHIRATVCGIDSEMNIGLLKLNSTTTLPVLKLGQSSHVYPGHFAISIGNQNGHLNSVALTLVSGIRDDGIPAGEHFYPGLIQIAGTVGAGTSGAPILNAQGEVIGMIVAIPFGDWSASPFAPMPMMPGPRPVSGPPPGGSAPRFVATADGNSPANTGKTDTSGPDRSATMPGPPGEGRIIFMRPPVTSAGLALPIDDMKPVLAGLRQNKNIHCWLGLDMRDERKREENDGVTTWKRTIFVKTIYPNSPAASSGLQVGDVLMTLNGRPLTRMTMIKAALLRAQSGDGMELRIDRKGAQHTVNIRLAARPEQTAAPASDIKH